MTSPVSLPPPMARTPITIHTYSDLLAVAAPGGAARDALYAELPNVFQSHIDVMPGGRWQRVIPVPLQSDPQFQLDEYGNYTFLRGLVPRVKGRLECDGYDVRVVEQATLSPELQVPPESRASLSPQEQSQLSLMVDNLPAHLTVRNLQEVGDHIYLLLRLFPATQILILTPNQQEADQLRCLLLSRGPSSYRYRGHQLPANVFLGPATMRTARHVYEGAIVVFSSVAAALTLNGQSLLDRLYWYWPPRRLIGFSRPDARRRYRPDLGEACFGPILNDPTSNRVLITVIKLTAPCPPQDRTLNPLDRKRRSYWLDRRRNEFMAAVLTAVLHRRTRQLASYGLSDAMIEDLSLPGPRVTCLVENEEHGRALLECLPTWRLLSGMCSTNWEDIPSAETTGEDPDRPCIVTQPAAMMHGLTARVVALADGGGLHMPRHRLKPVAISDRLERRWVIDFYDVEGDGHPPARRRRDQSYASEGYRVHQVAGSRQSPPVTEVFT